MIKILVCVKQVPDVERIRVEPGPDGMAALDVSNQFHMNRFDAFAVEEAVRIKEFTDGVHVDAITVGPERAADVLKRPMGMGADEGIHLKTPTDVDLGPGAVGAWIAGYARQEGYGLILCGSMSEDGMHGAVGPMLAVHMDIPYATQVIDIKPAPDFSELSIEREIEGGVREVRMIRLPALLALQPGINRPRYPSLSKLLRAHQKHVTTIHTETLATPNGLINCLGFKVPQRMRAARVLTGSAREKAEELVAILKEKAFV
jgi:electron transfer flavoprotein beta subunit